MDGWKSNNCLPLKTSKKLIQRSGGGGGGQQHTVIGLPSRPCISSLPHDGAFLCQVLERVLLHQGVSERGLASAQKSLQDAAASGH